MVKSCLEAVAWMLGTCHSFPISQKCTHRQLSMLAYSMCYVTIFRPQRAYEGFLLPLPEQRVKLCSSSMLYTAQLAQARLDSPTTYSNKVYVSEKWIYYSFL